MRPLPAHKKHPLITTLLGVFLVTGITAQAHADFDFDAFSVLPLNGDPNGGRKPGHGHGPGDSNGGSYPDLRDYYQLSCRYHNLEHHHGVQFCYASAVYRFDEEDRRFSNVRLGVGCDNTTLYNDQGYITVETTLDRLSPPSSAVPGVEIFPQGRLIVDGTYTSMLDIPAGRMQGLCYVRKLQEQLPRPPHSSAQNTN